MPVSKTIVISCAGMGTRLGIGSTKALIDVDGKPLLLRQLELLKEYDDIRIVVGYQKEKVIDMVTSFRKDILFVFNHDYKNTGTGASFLLGAQHSRDLVVALDGDLLVHPEDLKRVLEYGGEYICGTSPSTDNPVLLKTADTPQGKVVTGFSREEGEYEWTGLAQVRADRLGAGSGHVYQLLEPLLPMEMKEIRTKEIDTMDDYEHAVAWVRNGYRD